MIFKAEFAEGILTMRKAKQKKRQWKKPIKFIFSILLSMLIGASIGLLATRHLGVMFNGEKRNVELVILFILVFVEVCVALFLQIFIHETGHLVFGLLTGYRFLSFRIGSFMWVRENERLKVKRLSIAGTGGQCLLLPPESEDKKIPFVLYHLGGSIFNFVSGALFFILYMVFKNVIYLSSFLLLLSFLGIAFALLNAIPFKGDLVSNDGHNVGLCARDSNTLHAVCIQMKVVGELSQGIRLKDMPEEWFSFITLEEMQNAILAAVGVFAYNRLSDKHLFDEADRLAEQLLTLESLSGVHRNLLVCDRIYCELIGENRKDVLDVMRDKTQEKFMEAMKKFPSVLRTDYAYMLLVEKNKEKAEKIMQVFEKVARTYPYACEMESERELMNIAKQVSDYS